VAGSLGRGVVGVGGWECPGEGGEADRKRDNVVGDTDVYQRLPRFIPLTLQSGCSGLHRSIGVNADLRRQQRACYRQTVFIPCWLVVTTLVPSASITKISQIPSRSLSKAMRLPSGDHAGFSS
jgi:hypothetical protein